MDFIRKLSLCTVLLLFSGAVSKGALISNGDFSSGLSGYTTVGSAGTAGSYTFLTSSTNFTNEPFVPGTILPTSGAAVSQLRTTGGVAVSTIESTLGISGGSLQSLSDSLTHSNAHFTLGTGSAMSTSFEGSGTLTFDWNFWREDYEPFNDLSFFTISGPGISGSEVVLLSDVNGSAEALATTLGRGAGAGTGQQSYSYALPGTGVYTIGFGVVNSRDTQVPTYLYIDNIQASVLVPEAGQTLTAMLLVFSGLGLAMRRRRSS